MRINSSIYIYKTPKQENAVIILNGNPRFGKTNYQLFNDLGDLVSRFGVRETEQGFRVC
jgi:proteasome assembly chaperone (PAC2) family protein